MSDNYAKYFKKYGSSPKAMLWHDYRSSVARYKEIVADIDFDAKTVLDAGCGMGDLLPFIFAKSDNFQYLGVDSSEDFINIARKRYEGEKFEVADMFADTFAKKFDIVLCCGALNHNSDNWLQERKDKIAKLYSLANYCLAFNMAGGLAENHTVRNIAYANADEIIDFCKTLTPKLVFRGQYHPRDFTILLTK
jgi:SAM-dependent methyltransferase